MALEMTVLDPMTFADLVGTDTAEITKVLLKHYELNEDGELEMIFEVRITHRVIEVGVPGITTEAEGKLPEGEE